MPPSWVVLAWTARFIVPPGHSAYTNAGCKTGETVEPVLLDPGSPEPFGLARAAQNVVLRRYTTAVHRFRYNPLVCVTKPWPEIYVCDAERCYTRAESMSSNLPERVADVAYGYVLTEVP
jgi:predicted ATPase